MRKREELIEIINERIREMAAGEMAALFFIQLKETERETQTKENGRIVKIFSRFFRATDIVLSLGNGQFASFMSGRITERVVREKADMIRDVWLLAEEQFLKKQSAGYMGVCLFSDSGKSFSEVLQEAKEAEKQAEMDDGVWYCIHRDPGMQQGKLPEAFSSSFVRELMAQLDEELRFLEIGQEIRVFDATGEGSERERDPFLSVHPEDRERCRRFLYRTAASGEASECSCRRRKENGQWENWRLRFFRVRPASDGTPPAILEAAMNLSALERLKIQYRLCREWLGFVLERSDVLLWEVDIKNRRFCMIPTESGGERVIFENFPDSLIEGGRIHGDSAEAFRKFAGEMLRGNEEDSGNFIVRHRLTNAYGWASMSYRTLYDGKGRPQRAIGVKEDLSEFFGRRTQAVQRRAMPVGLYPYLYCYVQADLTADRVEKLQIAGSDQSRQEENRRYTSLLQSRLKRLFSNAEGEKIGREFSRKRLLRSFESGRRWFLERYRFADSQGRIHWTVLGINLTRDEGTGNVCLFAYLSIMDRRWKWEREATVAIRRRPGTELYEMDSLRAMAVRLLGRESRFPCGLAVIWLEGLGELLDGKNGSQEREELSAAFSVFLGTDCLAGWQSEDRIAVFYPRVSGKRSLARKIENAIAFIRLSLDDMPRMRHLRFIAGAVCAEVQTAEYDKMLETAQELCLIHAGEPADAVVFPDGEQWESWKCAALDGKEPVFPAEETAKSQEMSGEEKDLALQCMELMLQTDSTDSPEGKVLERLGNYYQAERVYILAFARKGGAAALSHEWYRSGLHSIRHAFFGRHIEDFPLFGRCLGKREPIFLSGRDEGERYQWKYLIFPIRENRDLDQFFCVEDPREHLDHTAVINRLAGLLVRGNKGPWEQEQKSGKAEKAREALFLLPNLQSYMDAVFSLDSEMYSSMGALTVDIPQMLELREQHGYEYVSQFILRISQILTDVFGKSFLFHTQEAEFVVLCTNMTYDIFVTRCRRVRILLEQQYIRQFRTGYTWSDGVFNARDLVGKARTIMCCDNPYAWELLSQGGEAQTQLESGARTAGQFTVFLQPKIDIRTGAIVGAEALVRVMDSSGNLLPHGTIIERMEREGTIQELDYFVFDRTLSLLSQWKRSGFPMLPVSTNFSRKTLLNPSALASLLAILSRYPDVPLELVEMEITETAGDFESNTLSTLIERFQEYGFCFSLDDFGSRYSNISMLADIRFSSVKLDRSMIRGISENLVTQMMIRNIVKICKSCGMVCIAEGVETKDQASALLREGCTCAQGYYYSRPVPAQEFEEKYFKNI